VAVVPVIDVTDTDAAKEDEKGPDSSQRASEPKKSAKEEEEDFDRLELSFQVAGESDGEQEDDKPAAAASKVEDAPK